MKTKELMRQLQEADPSGELECSVGNVDIHFVAPDRAYWDGSQQVLARDEAKAPYYNIVGAKYADRGTKVVINTLSIEDAIGNDAGLPVDFSELSTNRRADYEKAVEEYRRETIKIGNDVERDAFSEYVKKRFGLPRSVAEAYYNEHMDYRDKMPEDIRDMKETSCDGKPHDVIPSWHDRRCLQWDRQVTEEGGLLRPAH